MKILVMRHGDAEAPKTDDASRMLTDYGRQQAAKIGQWLAASAFVPGLMIVSPYRRAQETANIVLSHLSEKPECRTDKGITPEGSPNRVLDVLAKIKDQRVIMLVSHMPFVSDFIDVAVRGTSGVSLSPLPTAGLAMLEADIISRGTAKLVNVIYPENC